VALDAYQGWPIAAQIRLDYLQHFLIMNPDRSFKHILENPGRYYVSYFLVSNPLKVPADAIDHVYPGLWTGSDHRFVLVKSFPNTPPQWRLYRVETPVEPPSTKHADSYRPVGMISMPAPGSAPRPHRR
jgi:hypothetical protein